MTTIKNENSVLISAIEMYALIKQKDVQTERDNYRAWLADRIQSFEMEEGFDFFIYIRMESAREMIKYESVPKEVFQIINENQYIES
jgi:phage anti-repressor protein